MPPPEVWGPTVWTLFHTLAEQINDDAYPYLSRQMFSMIVSICNYLPCPDCANDSSKILAKVKIEDNKTKQHFKNTMYIFHNYVNVKKRKPLFNYSVINMYQKYNIINVVNNFIKNYNTKGNMKLLTESFKRELVIKNFKNWITRNIRAFIPTLTVPQPITMQQVEDVVEMEHVVEMEEVVKDNIELKIENIYDEVNDNNYTF